MSRRPDFCGPACHDFAKWNCALPWYGESMLRNTQTIAALALDATVQTLGTLSFHPIGQDVFGLIAKSRQRHDEAYMPAEVCVVIHTDGPLAQL